MNSLVRAITTQGLVTLDAVGKALGAGANCGSCRPEISNLLTRLGDPDLPKPGNGFDAD